MPSSTKTTTSNTPITVVPRKPLHSYSPASSSSNGGSNGSITTQARQSQQQQQHLKKRENNCVSKVIVGCAVVFFAVLMGMYSSLRPSADIRDKLPICGTPGEYFLKFFLEPCAVLWTGGLLCTIFLYFFSQFPR